MLTRDAGVTLSALRKDHRGFDSFLLHVLMVPRVDTYHRGDSSRSEIRELKSQPIRHQEAPIGGRLTQRAN